MCEAVYQQNPAYFQEFASCFRYYICEKYPSLPDTNYAISFHNQKNNSCPIKKLPHLHVLTYTATTATVTTTTCCSAAEKHLQHYQQQQQQHGYQVPCPYSCFKLLILGGVNYQCDGDMFQRLQTAVIYNDKYNTEEAKVKVCLSKLPKLNSSKTKTISTQTDLISSTTIERFLTVYNGNYGGEFNQIMDAFISGYGSIFSQQHSMIVNFELGCSNAQCICDSCNT
jgi:hypothetical protein